MTTSLRLACVSAALVLACTAPRADLVDSQLNFNELSVGSSGVHLPGGYGGFNWGDQWYLMPASFGGTQSHFLATSTSGGTLIRRTDHGAFFFDGADFWSRRGLDAGGDFFFVLYGTQGQTLYDGNLDGNTGRMRFTGSPQTMLANYTGAIHGVAWGFDNDDYDHLAMDNFRFRVEALPAVPEPGTALLASLGLAVLLIARRVRG